VHAIFYRYLLFLLPIVPLCASAQQADDHTQDGFGIEANMMGGKVLKHTAKFTGPVPDLSTALGVVFLQQTDGRKEWQQRRNYPLWGVGITYTDYGLDSVYGKCIGVYPMLQIPIIRSKKIDWTLQFGLGLGYVTRRYSHAPDWDTLNNAISSHVNNFTLFATDLRYHVNKHWDVQLGANFSHISNATFRQPNLGINMYGVHLGARYFLTTSTPEKMLRKLAPLRNRWLIQARLGLAMTSTGNGGGPLYPVYLTSLYASKRYASKNKAFIGIDYSYHSNVYAFLKNNEIWPGEEKAHSWKSAVFVGHEWLMGRGAILLQVGVYIKNAYLRLDPYYEKLGYNYYLIRQEKGLLKELYLSAILKTHLTQAELGEFGLGFSF
jgi:hypothetical protein